MQVVLTHGSRGLGVVLIDGRQVQGEIAEKPVTQVCFKAQPVFSPVFHAGKELDFLIQREPMIDVPGEILRPTVVE